MRIIVVGFGTVGQSFCKLLQSKLDEFVKEFGMRPRIVAVVDRGGAVVNGAGLDMEAVLSAKRQRGTVASTPGFSIRGRDAIDVIQDVESEVVVEVTSTNAVDGEPGLSHIKAALGSGKNVITTNKGPLAIALPSLMELASYNHVYLRFSGTVGGGTPILDLAKKCIVGNRIRSLRGILNGTTNYMLTRMAEANVPMEDALREAKDAGYAEADPTYDVSGLDTAFKLVIMANWIMGMEVSIRDVEVKGIEHVTLREVEEAAGKGSMIKLIGSIEGGLKVKPEPVPKIHPLCVGGTLNAVTFNTELSGEITLVGRGAGGIETSTAILRDLIDIRRLLMR